MSYLPLHFESSLYQAEVTTARQHQICMCVCEYEDKCKGERRERRKSTNTPGDCAIDIRHNYLVKVIPQVEGAHGLGSTLRRDGRKEK